MPRKPNLFYDLAVDITEEMGNPHLLKMVLKHLSTLKKEGVDVEIAVACWRWLRTDGVPKEDGEPFIIKEANLLTILKGQPTSYLEQFKQYVLRMPPVFEVQAHDDWVKKYADVLRKLGFTYQGWAEESDQTSERRLTYSQVEALGLLPR